MNPTKALSFNCKICGKARVTYADESCPEHEYMRFKKLLTCDRCFNLMRTRRDTFEAVCRICGMVNGVRTAGSHAQKSKLANEMDAVRRKLADLANKYAQSVAEFYGEKEYPWDACVVEYLLESPQSAWKLMGQLGKTVRQFLIGKNPGIVWNRFELADFRIKLEDSERKERKA